MIVGRLGGYRAVLEPFRDALRASWGSLKLTRGDLKEKRVGSSKQSFGTPQGDIGVFLDGPWVSCSRFGAVSGSLGAVLMLKMQVWEGYRAVLGRSWGHIGQFWMPHKAILAVL